jgi:glucose-1-phosphate thymidylyltransferase
MEIAKALILAGDGPDGRRCATAPSSPPHLFPMANRPILFHNLEALRTAGILEASILARGETGAAIRRAVADGRRWGLTIRHADWGAELGLPGALAGTRDFLAGEPVLVQRGDALLHEHMHAHICAFAREKLDALALRLAPPVAEATPGYLLSPRAVRILREGPSAPDGPIAGVLAGGGRVREQPVDGCLPCAGDVESLLEGNRRALEALARSVPAEAVEDCRVQGAVEIHPTARVTRSLLRGPLVIGPGARITDAYVGPYSSIGAGVIVEGTEIEHSIVLPEAQLCFVGTRLESSVIGHGARVVRDFQLPGALRLAIGDGAEVVLR